MLTHKIIITRPPYLEVVHNRMRPQVNSQEELDEYLKKFPWAYAGNFLCHDHTTKILNSYSIHYIAEIIRDYALLCSYPNGAMELLPRVMRIVCMNIDDNGSSTWDRRDNLRGYRELTQEEKDTWVNNDHVQNRLKLWKKLNGFGEK